MRTDGRMEKELEEERVHWYPSSLWRWCERMEKDLEEEMVYWYHSSSWGWCGRWKWSTKRGYVRRQVEEWAQGAFQEWSTRQSRGGHQGRWDTTDTTDATEILRNVEGRMKLILEVVSAGRSGQSCLKDGHLKSAECWAVLDARRVKSCRQDEISRQDSELVSLDWEASIAIRIEHQGKQDSEVFQLE